MASKFGVPVAVREKTSADSSWTAAAVKGKMDVSLDR